MLDLSECGLANLDFWGLKVILVGVEATPAVGITATRAGVIGHQHDG